MSGAYYYLLSGYGRWHEGGGGGAQEAEQLVSSAYETLKQRVAPVYELKDADEIHKRGKDAVPEVESTIQKLGNTKVTEKGVEEHGDDFEAPVANLTEHGVAFTSLVRAGELGDQLTVDNNLRDGRKLAERTESLGLKLGIRACGT